MKLLMKFQDRFDWPIKILTDTEKQAVEDIPVEYHDIFAGHTTDIGMNTDFKVKLTPNKVKAVYSQSTSMLIHSKEDLIVELAFTHKAQVWDPYSSTLLIVREPPFAQKKNQRKIKSFCGPHEKYISNCRKSIKNFHPVSSLSDAAQHMAEKPLFCKLGCSQAYHCLQIRTNSQLIYLGSILLAEPQPTKELSKVSADLCVLLQASCVTTWTQLTKLTKVLSTCTILELQPTLL